MGPIHLNSKCLSVTQIFILRMYILCMYIYIYIYIYIMVECLYISVPSEQLNKDTVDFKDRRKVAHAIN